jgi:hypothetical protein
MNGGVAMLSHKAEGLEGRLRSVHRQDVSPLKS